MQSQIQKGLDSLAQLVEHSTFNAGVLGSSPKRVTKKSRNYLRLFFVTQGHPFLTPPLMVPSKSELLLHAHEDDGAGADFADGIDEGAVDFEDYVLLAGDGAGELHADV